MTKYVISHGRRIAVETMEPPTAPRRRKDGRHFGCPLDWAKRVRKVLHSLDQVLVAIWLHRRRTIYRKDLFPVPNRELELELGINRKVKYKTLRYLEKAGAIAIVRNGRHAIQVQILW
jgi:hypothetical protein